MTHDRVGVLRSVEVAAQPRARADEDQHPDQLLAGVREQAAPPGAGRGAVLEVGGHPGMGEHRHPFGCVERQPVPDRGVLLQIQDSRGRSHRDRTPDRRGLAHPSPLAEPHRAACGATRASAKRFHRIRVRRRSR